MTTSPLVTVAIPSYNHAKYISQTIESILGQTFQDFEILIVDDSSTDNSLEIIRSFKDPRIRIIESAINQGVCETANICIKNANGKYMALIASDDVMISDKLEKQVNFLEKNENYGAVFSGIEIINEDGDVNPKKTKKYTKVFEKENRSRFEWLNYFFHHGNCIAAPTLLAKVDAIKKSGGFDFRINQAHDLDLWVRMCLAGYEIHIIHEKLLQYRQRENKKNLSSNTEEVRIRLLFDNENILSRFLAINCLKYFNEIFHVNINSDLKFSSEEEIVIAHYLLVLQALKKRNSPYHLQFAVSLLYKILEKNNAMHLLNKIFNFDLKQYTKLINNSPIGNLSEKLNRTIMQKIFHNFFRSN